MKKTVREITVAGRHSNKNVWDKKNDETKKENGLMGNTGKEKETMKI